MTQRIFDMDNPQDVKDLFDILPDNVKAVVKDVLDNEQIELYDKDDMYIGFCSYIRIDWRNKKEITRPVDEREWIGCLCWFWDDKKERPILGELDSIYGVSCRYHRKNNAITVGYEHCRPVRRDEIKFVEDVE